MNAEELNRLLEKYYKGESTGEEDNVLSEYFNKENIPEGYEAEKEVFGYYKTAGKIPEPSHDFEARILAGIDAAEKSRGSHKGRKNILPYLSAAAGLIFLAGSYFFFINRSDSVDTFKNPEIAYAETMKILLDISSQLNRGTQTLEPVGKMNEMTAKSFKTLNKSTVIIEKSLKNLGFFPEAIENVNMHVNKKINK